MKKGMVAGCLLGILLLLVTLGGGLLLVGLVTPSYVPALYGGVAGLCWAWLMARAPRRTLTLPRLRRLMYWELFVAALAGALLAWVFTTPPLTTWGRCWLFVLPLVAAYNAALVVMRLLLLRRLAL